MIEVEHLSKSFGRRKVLDDVSFGLEQGGFLSIFGPNGAGKTTLIKVLSTLIPPSSGAVRINGLSLGEDSVKIRERIGLISHNPLLYLDLNADENLRFYAAMYQIPETDSRIDELLDRVELGHRRYDLVGTFSRGMLQRLAIARALLHRPTILFLDEPHAGLDPHAVDILDGLIENVRADHTFIMITHNLEKGLSLCSAAMILFDGRIVYHEKKKELDAAAFRGLYRTVVAGEG